MKTINGWTKASLIEFIVTNFSEQSLDEDENCAYRGLFGAKCAVGLFVPEDKYSPNMEGERAIKVIRDYHLDSYMPLEAASMMVLQDVHDCATPKTCLADMLEFIQENVED